jgi:predicted flap endonuclease-1-like 5' DNA nuclease
MNTTLIASLFCMDNLLPILVGLLGAALLGYLLRGFMGGSGGSGSTDLQAANDKLTADLAAERERNAKLASDAKRKKGNDAQAFAVAAPKNDGEIDNLNNKIKNLRLELKAEQDKAAEHIAEATAAKERAKAATTLNSEVETLKTRIHGLTRALDASKAEADKYRDDFENANSERSRLSAQLSGSDLGAIKKQVEKLENDLQAARMTNASLQAENDRLQAGPKTVYSAQSSSDDKIASANAAELRDTIAALKKELGDAKFEAERLKKDSETAKMAINVAVNDANTKSNQEIADLKRQLKLAEADVIRARDENTRLAQMRAGTAVEIKQAEAPSAPAAPVVEEKSAAVEEAPAAVAAPSAPVDDLKVVEGIGPAIERILNDAGITSYAQVADMSGDQIKTVLEAGGNKLNDPTTWPEQAALLRDGKMEEFAKLEAELIGGRRVQKNDDLKIVEGIGPVIEGILNDAGITSFAQVASMSVDELKALLEAGGSKLSDPTTWAEQAALLRDGKMEEFEKLAAELKGGRRVD